MAAGAPVNTLGTLIRYTMMRGTAERVKRRFIEMSMRDEPVSYLDCVFFDAALETLGEEQAYYGYSDDEWRKMLDDRAAAETRYRVVEVDVTKELEGAVT